MQRLPPPPRLTSRLQHERSSDGAEEQSTGGVLAGARDAGLLGGGGRGLSGGGPGGSGGLRGGHGSSAGDQGGHGGGLHGRALAGGLVLATPAGAVATGESGGLDERGASLAGATLGSAGLAASALGVGLDGELSAVLEDASAILNDQHAVAGGGLLGTLRQRAGDVPFVGLSGGGDTLDNGGLVVHAVGAVAAAEDEGDSGSLVASGIPGDLVGLALCDGLKNVSKVL